MSATRSPSELPEPINVMALPIRPLRTDDLIGALVSRAKARLETTACYANAHTVNLVSKNAQFAATLRAADVLYADGASVVWASRFASARLPERMTAADYFERFVSACADAGLSVFFLGGAPGLAERAAAILKTRNNSLRVAGHLHGFFEDVESPDVVATINAAAPDVLVVGMSSPRQELWLARHREQIEAPVRWCVGAVMDYVAGEEARAPAWLCRIGGEWLFRLLVDPVGKWRRYLIGNPLFIYRALRWGWAQRRLDAAIESKSSEARRAAVGP